MYRYTRLCKSWDFRKRCGQCLLHCAGFRDRRFMHDASTKPWLGGIFREVTDDIRNLCSRWLFSSSLRSVIGLGAGYLIAEQRIFALPRAESPHFCHKRRNHPIENGAAGCRYTSCLRAALQGASCPWTEGCKCPGCRSCFEGGRRAAVQAESGDFCMTQVAARRILNSILELS